MELLPFDLNSGEKAAVGKAFLEEIIIDLGLTVMQR